MSGGATAVRAWIGIAGTWAIAFLAVWGEQIRAALFKPKLQIKLLNNLGERTRHDVVVLESGQAKIVRSFPVRYYHIRVTNRSRVVAHDVQVLVTQLDLRGPGGNPQTIYKSAHLPLVWIMQEIYGRVRTIGRATAADADLLFVQSEFLKIVLAVTPNNFPDTMSGASEQHFWLTVVARGLESESKPLRLKIDWDGKWEDGDNEMGRHLTVAPG
jgi:hypothetical protein